MLLNADQCPTSYTQEQIAESGCIVGANIGRGLAMLSSVALAVVTVAAAMIILMAPVLTKFFRRRRHL